MAGRIALFFAFLVLTGVASLAQEVGDKVVGEQLAEEFCADCHGVHADDIFIPNADATHFADTANTPGITARALHAWLQSSHPTMPNIVLTARQRDDLIAYILSLKGL